MTKKKQWTWADHPIYGRGRNVIKDEARSLSYGDVTVIPSMRMNDPVYGPEGVPDDPEDVPRSERPLVGGGIGG